SDTIFADENTITGSIGVVGGKLATSGMWKKVGITFKSYTRGQHAGLLGSADVFSKPEREKMQAWMDDIYGVFKVHVTTVRGLDPRRVKSVTSALQHLQLIQREGAVLVMPEISVR